MSCLSLTTVSARLDGRPVLDDVSLSLRAGELVALCGPNGAGKSSVLRVAVGLLPTTSGEVRLADRPLGDLSHRARAEQVAYLPQERDIAWNMPAVEIVALGAPFLSTAEAQERARAALDEVGASALSDRGVADMSGGERARVHLARALVADAETLLADEPIAGLDPDAQLMVLERLRARAERGQAVLLSLHDLTLAARFADRIVVLAEGRVVADALPLEALSPQVLKSVFGVVGDWIDGPSGPLLDVSRAWLAVG